MPQQKAEAKKKEEFCDKAGKLAGDVTRQLYSIKKQVEKQLIKLSASTYQVTKQTFKKGKKAVKNSVVICAGLERKWELWRGQQKRQAIFTQLGTEVSRLHKEQVKNVLNQPKVKRLIKQVRKIEQNIAKLKNSIEVQQSKKEKTRKRTKSKKKKSRF